MKCITVFYNVSISDEVIAAICEAGVKEYSVIPRTHGCGATSGARFDNHVWPGHNSVLVMVVDASSAPKVMDALQKLRNTPRGRRSGLYAYQTAVEAALQSPD